MSIIYDAIKKAERVMHSQPPRTKPAPRQGKAEPGKVKVSQGVIILAIVAIISAGFYLFYEPRIVSRQAQTPKVPPVCALPPRKNPYRKTYRTPYRSQSSRDEVSPAQLSIQAEKYAPVEQNIPDPFGNIVLNGIFFSEEQGYALINDQILKEGDSFDGITIKRVGANEVELTSGSSNTTLILSTQK